MSALPKQIEESGRPGTIRVAISKTASSSGWPELRAWGEHLEDLYKSRIATENRARFFPYPEIFAEHVERITEAEHKCALALRRCYRRTVPAPIRAWQEKHPGLGEHLIARLLGHLGHPVHAEPKHWEGTGEKRTLIAEAPRDRTVSALWQFCGHGDPARKKVKGMTAEEAAGLGNPTLKMLVHLLAEACVRAKTTHGGRYGEVYDLRRIVTATRVHAAPCVRCGPSGKPALAGSPWSKAHQHADAQRIVGKEILRDLWIAARGSEIETTGAGQRHFTTQDGNARPRHSSKTREGAIDDSKPTDRTPSPATKKVRAGQSAPETHMRSARPRRLSKSTPRTNEASKPNRAPSVAS